MSGEISKKWLLLCEAICFILIFLALWVDELLDLPYLLFGLPPTAFEWCDASIESAIVILLGAIVMALTWKMASDEKSSSSHLIQVCAVCRKVSMNSRWVPLDTLIEAGMSGTLTHGICPDCMDTYYKGVTDTTALNFKQVLKTRQTEE